MLCHNPCKTQKHLYHYNKEKISPVPLSSKFSSIQNVPALLEIKMRKEELYGKPRMVKGRPQGGLLSCLTLKE
jgi:hypothetical protein